MRALALLGRPSTVLALVLSGFFATTAAPASACACGGVVSPDPAAAVNSEAALVHWDGSIETIVMRLTLQSSGANAALVIPTPAPAEVTAGKASTFDELEELTAPRIRTKLQWWESRETSGGSGEYDTATAGAPGGGPTVLTQVRLGPLEATTLSGGDLPGLQTWLATNDYTMKPEVTASLAPYVDEGWAFVAMRLTSDVPLAGGLDPVTLTFPSTRMVYPMRMSVAAGRSQEVTVYTLSEHRQRRSDADADTQSVDTEFAGRIDGVRDPDLADLVGSGAYLTRLSTFIGDPKQISSDFEFSNAATDEEYVRYRYVSQDVRIFGFMGGPFLVAGGAFVVVGLAVLGFALVRTGRLRRS